jgi:hypothetical protein
MATFKGVKGLYTDKNKSKIYSIEELDNVNNLFEVVEEDNPLRVVIDIDSYMNDDILKTMDNISFNKINNKLIRKLKQLEDINIACSSHFRAEKWVFDNAKDVLKETKPKFSFKISYFFYERLTLVSVLFSGSEKY